MTKLYTTPSRKYSTSIATFYIGVKYCEQVLMVFKLWVFALAPKCTLNGKFQDYNDRF